MSIWHAAVIRTLQRSGLFTEVQLSGGKIRAMLTPTRFLDIHFDPTSGSYSYALIDLTLPYEGDKRLFGWDDFPHPGYVALTSLRSYPHHFQERLPEGGWKFAESSFHGDVENEILVVMDFLREKQKPGQ